ncbi:MAG: hypothetical protein Q7S27_03305 [Nanoarchaeota archaeon]|nr:hypothetical protein [Nanoarchaeota archaeon]
MRGVHTVIALLYLILGIYLINIPFKFLEIPTLFSQIEQWIFLACGVLLLMGAFLYYNQNKNQPIPYR